MQETPPTTQNYFADRMAAYGITDANNYIELLQTDLSYNEDHTPSATHGNTVLVKFPIFKPHEKGIEIMPYHLSRHKVLYKKDESTGKRENSKPYTIIRLHPEVTRPDGEIQKYMMPKGQGTPPLIPPALVAAYEAKTKIDVLYLTEGYFKAFKAGMHGMHCIGLISITCMIDKETGKMHDDILKIIDVCQVRRIVWLTDNDCRQITKDEITIDKDLYKRVHGFYMSINKFYELLQGIDNVSLYFAHINEDLDSKGLDDLLIAQPDSITDIVTEATTFNKITGNLYQGNYFTKFNISYGLSAVRNYFILNDVTLFYLHHVELRKDLKGKKFRFNGTIYSYNSEEGKCIIEVPRNAADYFRVGDTYYEFIKRPNRYGELVDTFHARLKSTINDDHGKTIFSHIAKYKAFCNVPDHTNYQRVIEGSFNTYHPFLHVPEAASYDTTLKYIKHVFGENEIELSDGARVPYYELGLDYLTLLYKAPQRILPILCLVSKERNTGKSTFLKWLKLLFTENLAVVGNQDFENGFNAHWTTKLVVAVDETKIDKQHVIERIKSLSTSNNAMMNAKGKDQIEMEIFMKFILCSNNEENFINIDREEVRFWVIKVPVITNLVLDIEVRMMDEIPAFLHFLNTRKMVTKNEFRHWFNPAYLVTDTLRKIQQNSAPTLWKVIRGKLTTMFEDHDVNEINIPKADIKEYMLKGYKFEDDYIKKVLGENGYHLGKPVRGGYPKWIEVHNNNETEKRVQLIKFHNRCYTFLRADFTDAEMGSVQSELFTAPANIETSAVLNNDDLPF